MNPSLGASTTSTTNTTARPRHIGVDLSIDDWQKFGHEIPLLVNMQPAGFYLGEEYHRAGGVPAGGGGIMTHKRIHRDAPTRHRHTMGENSHTRPQPRRHRVPAH